MRKIIEKIDATAERVMELSVIPLFVIGIIYIIYAVLKNNIPAFAQWVITPFGHLILKYVLIIVLCIFLVALLCRFLCFPWVKSDDKKEVEQMVEIVLRQREKMTQKSEEKPITQVVDNEYDPLQNLDEEQAEEVRNLLRQLPESKTKPGYINLALMAQHIKALSEMGYLVIKDLYELRPWVAKITGKSVHKTSQFNEAIANANKKKIVAAKQFIHSALE